jgi:hypothetical protein
MTDVERFKDDSQYYSDTKYLSNSNIGRMIEDVHTFKKYLDGEYEYPSNPNFVVGRLVHTAVLEPEKYTDFKVVVAKDRRSKAYKEAVAEHGFDWVVTEPEHLMAQEIKDNIEKNDRLSEMLVFASTEVPFTRTINGVDCKGKVDAVTEIDGKKVIIDLKTTGKAVTDFPKSARAFSYDRQAAMYLELTGADEFVFLVANKETRSLGLFTCSDNFINGGTHKLMYALDMYKELFINGGYTTSYMHLGEL